MFDIRVIRCTEDGRTYEDTIDHLSESGHEVTRPVFTLAGYLVHEFHETLPFIVLNSLKAFDSERIAALVKYFREYAEYLIVVLLPKYAADLDESHQHITSERTSNVRLCSLTWEDIRMKGTASIRCS